MGHTHVSVVSPQGSVEPMQIDADPQEDQQNAQDINYIVENPTLVCVSHVCSWIVAAAALMEMYFVRIFSHQQHCLNHSLNKSKKTN